MQRIPTFDLPANPINPFPEINWFEFAREMLALYNPDSHYCQRCHKETWADKVVTSYPRDFVWPCNGGSRTDTLYIPVILCRECGKSADGNRPDNGDYCHAILGGIIIPFTKYSLPFVLTVLDSYANRTGTVEDVCEQWGICRNTLYNWIGRYMEQYDLWAGSLHGTGVLGREAQSGQPGFRNLYSLIAPVIQGTFPDASEAAYYRRVTQEPVSLPGGGSYKYSPDTLERWASHYRKDGMDGLMPKIRKDKGTSRVIDDGAADEIGRYLELFPHASGVAIHEHLIRCGFLPAVVSVRAVQRYLKEQGMNTPREGTFRVRRAFEMDKFGKSWQADTACLPSITVRGEKKPRKTFVIMIIDDHSRMIVGGGIFFNDNTLNFQEVLKAAVIAYGIPDVLYMDNGGSYSNGQLSFVPGNPGILKKHAKVRDGASKGKAGRNFRILRSRWVSTLDFSSITSPEQLDGLLQDYIETHNKTFHTGIGGRPIDRYMRTRSYIRVAASRDWPEDSFYNRITRKVRNDNVVKINSTEYDVPAQFTGMNVEIRFSPSDMGAAYILYDGSRFPIRKTDRAENSSADRASDALTLTYNAIGGSE